MTTGTIRSFRTRRASPRREVRTLDVTVLARVDVFLPPRFAELLATTMLALPENSPLISAPDALELARVSSTTNWSWSLTSSQNSFRLRTVPPSSHTQHFCGKTFRARTVFPDLVAPVTVTILQRLSFAATRRPSS